MAVEVQEDRRRRGLVAVQNRDAGERVGCGCDGRVKAFRLLTTAVPGWCRIPNQLETISIDVVNLVIGVQLLDQRVSPQTLGAQGEKPTALQRFHQQPAPTTGERVEPRRALLSAEPGR